MEINRVNKTNFKGLEKMKNVEQPFENHVQKMIDGLLKRAEREVPEYGDFKPVYEIITNTNKDLNATDFVLKISKSLRNDPKLRVLDASAYNIPNPSRYERSVLIGTKEDILNTLKDEKLKDNLVKIYTRLSSHF